MPRVKLRTSTVITIVGIVLSLVIAGEAPAGDFNWQGPNPGDS